MQFTFMELGTMENATLNELKNILAKRRQEKKKTRKMELNNTIRIHIGTLRKIRKQLEERI